MTDRCVIKGNTVIGPGRIVVRARQTDWLRWASVIVLVPCLLVVAFNLGELAGRRHAFSVCLAAVAGPHY